MIISPSSMNHGKNEKLKERKDILLREITNSFTITLIKLIACLLLLLLFFENKKSLITTKNKI